MDAFSYLSVLISLILGLAITQVLKGFRGLMHARPRTKIYWPTLIWAALIIIVAVQSWWSMFGLRERLDWTFLEFSAVLAQTIVTYLLAALVLPDIAADAAIDLREHYYNHRRWFFSLLVALLVISVLKQYVLVHHLQEPMDLGFHGLFAATSIVSIVVARPRWHEFGAVLAIILIGAYIALLFGHLH
ncbi:MAG TPA: hypothetical protein VJ696_06240 [Rhodanobacteraceae bacterium]|nr:hypothetical protein [Rhodanobacteraceae bacterium]